MKKALYFMFSFLCLGLLVGCNINMGGNSQTTEHEVTFVSEGVTIETVQVSTGEVVLQPVDPIKEGYNFLGWFLNETKWDFNIDVVNDNITLEAKWEKQEEVVPPTVETYQVNLNLNGGTMEGETVIEFTDYTKVVLPVPTRENYTFKGWYKGTTLYESLTENANYYLTAQWVGTEYKVTYHVDGGVLHNLSRESYNYGSGLIIYAPTKEGYNFEGWYDNPEFTGTKLTNISNGITKVYAKWSIDQNQVNNDAADLVDVYIYNLTTRPANVNATTVGYVKQMYENLTREGKQLVENYATLRELIAKYM